MPAPPPTVSKPLAKAFSALPYNAFFVLPHEYQWLERYLDSVPAMFKQISPTDPVTFNWQAGGMQVALLAFPLPKRGKPDEKLMDKVAAKLSELDKTTDVLIGLSPWGQEPEQAFLDKYPKALDILLGSGDGKPFTGMQGSERTFWSRSYRQGKAFLTIKVHSPDSSQTTDGAAFQCTATADAIRETVQPDPEITEILNKIRAQ